MHLENLDSQNKIMKQKKYLLSQGIAYFLEEKDYQQEIAIDPFDKSKYQVVVANPNNYTLDNFSDWLVVESPDAATALKMATAFDNRVNCRIKIIYARFIDLREYILSGFHRLAFTPNANVKKWTKKFAKSIGKDVTDIDKNDTYYLGELNVLEWLNIDPDNLFLKYKTLGKNAKI